MTQRFMCIALFIAVSTAAAEGYPGGGTGPGNGYGGAPPPGGITMVPNPPSVPPPTGGSTGGTGGGVYIPPSYTPPNTTSPPAVPPLTQPPPPAAPPPVAPPPPPSPNPNVKPHPRAAHERMRWSESYLVAQAEGRPLPKRLRGEVQQLDSDGNGALSTAEIAGSPGEGFRLHLLMFDADHDGSLDRRELQRATSQWRSVMQVPLF